MRQHDRVQQPVRKIGQAADLVGDGVRGPEQRGGEGQAGLQAGAGQSVTRLYITGVVEGREEVLGDTPDGGQGLDVAQEVRGFRYV